MAELTYAHPPIRDGTLDDNLPASVCSGKGPTRSRAAPAAGLGDLGVLPLELMQSLLCQLDLHSLANFQLVNRRAFDVVSTTPEYKAITTHAPQTLKCIQAIRTRQWISCETLFETLCTANCQVCGDFGGYLYLLTCERVCFLCLAEDARYLPLPHHAAIQKFGLSHDAIDAIPHMVSIPGTYSPNERKSPRRLGLVDYDSAYRAGVALHGSRRAMVQHVAGVAAKELHEYNKGLSLTQWELISTPCIRWPYAEEFYDGQSGNPLRFMAVARAPWLDRKHRAVEWGFHCVGCDTGYAQRPTHFRRKFTAEQFQEHLKLYGDIQNGRHRHT